MVEACVWNQSTAVSRFVLMLSFLSLFSRRTCVVNDVYTVACVLLGEEENRHNFTRRHNDILGLM